MHDLKAFLKLSDHSPAFTSAKARGAAGIPCFVLEDGTVELSPKDVGLHSLSSPQEEPVASTAQVARHILARHCPFSCKKNTPTSSDEGACGGDSLNDRGATRNACNYRRCRVDLALTAYLPRSYLYPVLESRHCRRGRLH